MRGRPVNIKEIEQTEDIGLLFSDLDNRFRLIRRDIRWKAVLLTIAVILFASAVALPGLKASHLTARPYFLLVLSFFGIFAVVLRRSFEYLWFRLQYGNQEMVVRELAKKSGIVWPQRSR